MEKILVATDISPESRSAVKVAIQQALVRAAALEIVYVYRLQRPYIWSASAFDTYSSIFRQIKLKELSKFFRKLWHDAGKPGLLYHLALVRADGMVMGIINYAIENSCSFICIATNGTSGICKIFCTHTGKLIGNSPLPVLTVPSKFRLRSIQSIVYASDMTDYERELKQVITFARPTKARICLLYIGGPYEFDLRPEKDLAFLKQSLNYDFEILVVEQDPKETFLECLDRMIKKMKWQLLVLFTHQHRTFTDKLIFPSNAKDYAYQPQIPLLTFPKFAD